MFSVLKIEVGTLPLATRDSATATATAACLMQALATLSQSTSLACDCSTPSQATCP